MYQEKSIIIKNDEISTNMVDMLIDCKKIAEASQAGQFLNLKVTDSLEPLLRRPISISRVDREKGTISLVYHVIGKGTQLMSKMLPGQVVDIMGPLGNGFPLFSDKKCAVVGGGIGVAPLLELTAHLPHCDAFLGFRNAPIMIDAFSAYCAHTYVATEDGSSGYKGYVTDVLSDKIKAYEVVYTCGPKVMMARVKAICEAEGIPCYVSVEERMGCGIGACLVCACKIKEQSGEWHYKKACADGPVFAAEEVAFDD